MHEEQRGEEAQDSQAEPKLLFAELSHDEKDGEGQQQISGEGAEPLVAARNNVRHQEDAERVKAVRGRQQLLEKENYKWPNESTTYT